MKSEIEIYWEAIAAKFGNTREWTNLHPQEQHMIIQSVNLLFAVLGNPIRKEEEFK